MEEAYKSEEYKGLTINWYYDTESDNNPRDWDVNMCHMICWHRSYRLGDKHDYSNADSLLVDLVNLYVSDEDIKEFLVSHKGDCYVEWEEYEGSPYDLPHLGKATLHDGSGNPIYDESWECDSLDKFLDEIDVPTYLTQNDMKMLLEPYMVISPVSIYDHGGITIWIGSPSDPWDSCCVGYMYLTKADVIKCIKDATEENWKDKALLQMDSEMQVYDLYARGEVFWWQILDEDEEVVDSCGGYYGTDAIEEQMPECREIIDDYIERRAIQQEIAWEENIIKNCLEFTYA